MRRHLQSGVSQGLWRDSRRPPFKGGDGEQGHHGHQDVVEVKVAVVPHPLVDGGLVDVSVLVQDEGAPARGRQRREVSDGGCRPAALRPTHLHSSGLDLASSVQR